MANTQASWEDRDIDFWARVKVDGFLLSEPGAALPTRDRPPEEDELVSLLGRLRRAGIQKNCLSLTLPTRQSLYGHANAAAPFVKRATTTVSHAADAGAWGIALDTRTAASTHEFTWNGHGDPPPSRDELRKNAVGLGSALGRAFTQSERIERVLVLTDELDDMGPLWFSLIDGLLRGIDGASKHFHLVVCSSERASDLRGLRAKTTKMLQLRLSVESLRVWERLGSIDFGLQLTSDGSSGTETGEILPEGGVEALRETLISGKLNAAECVLNTGQIPAGWRSPDSEITPVSFETPMDAYTRVGRLAVAGEEALVLRGSEGAVAVLPSGIPSRVSIPAQARPVWVTNLRTYEVARHPADKSSVELDATDTPTMVTGLPIRAWVAPAGLWINAEYPPAGQTRVVDVIYGWANRTGVGMDGVVESLVPERFAIAPSGIPFSTADGESVSATGRISGAFGEAPSVAVRLVVAAPQGEPIVRDFPLEFPPPLRWIAQMDGPIAAAPAVADLDGDGQPEVYAASLSGDVASFGPKGELRWRWESLAPVTTGPVAFRHWSGTPHLAVLDDAGWFHCYKPDGVLRFEESVGVPVRNGSLCTANLHGFPGQELVCALESGQLVALLSNGQELWKVDAEHEILGFAIATGSGKRDTVIAVLDDAVCMAVAADGSPKWRITLPAAPVSFPVIDTRMNSDQPSVIIGLENGAIARLALGDGAVHDVRQAPNGIIPRRIVLANLATGGDTGFLIADGTSVTRLTASMNATWTLNVKNEGYPLPIETARGPLVLLPTREGEVWAVDHAGTVVWKERRSAASVAPVLTPLAGARSPGCIYASCDGFIRAIDIPY